MDNSFTYAEPDNQNCAGALTVSGELRSAGYSGRARETAPANQPQPPRAAEQGALAGPALETGLSGQEPPAAWQVTTGGEPAERKRQRQHNAAARRKLEARRELQLLRGQLREPWDEIGAGRRHLRQRLADEPDFLSRLEEP